MVALARTVTSVDISFRASQIALFDAIADENIARGMTTLFERYSPGAAETLRIWAESRDLRCEWFIHSDFHVLQVKPRNGSWISVQVTR